MPTLFQKFLQSIHLVPQWHYSLQENITGYRTYAELYKDYWYLSSGDLEPSYYKEVGNREMPYTASDIKNGMIIYSRAGRPKLDFLVIGRKSTDSPSTPKYPLIDLAMRENFKTMDESRNQHGSVLQANDKYWTFLANDLFMTGGIANQKPFYLASPRTKTNLWHSSKGHTTIFGRELIGLFAIGYELQHLADGSEAMVPPCGAPRALDLNTYSLLRSRFRNSDNVAYIMHPSIRRFTFHRATMEFHPEFYFSSGRY